MRELQQTDGKYDVQMPFSASQILMHRSLEPEIMKRESAVKWAAATDRVCPSKLIWRSVDHKQKEHRSAKKKTKGKENAMVPPLGLGRNSRHRCYCLQMRPAQDCCCGKSRHRQLRVLVRAESLTGKLEEQRGSFSYDQSLRRPCWRTRKGIPNDDIAIRTTGRKHRALTAMLDVIHFHICFLLM